MRIIKTPSKKPMLSAGEKKPLSKQNVTWELLVPYVLDMDTRLENIEKKQDQLLFLLSQIVKDVHEKRKLPSPRKGSS